jgi:hypothetical protein
MENLKESIDIIKNSQHMFSLAIKNAKSQWDDRASQAFVKKVSELNGPMNNYLRELEQISDMISKAHRELDGY